MSPDGAVAAVQFLTLIVVAWYTIITNKLANEARKQREQNAELVKIGQQQNEMSIMPVITLQRTGNGLIHVVNVGKGPAFNVSFTGFVGAGMLPRADPNDIPLLLPSQPLALRTEGVEVWEFSMYQAMNRDHAQVQSMCNSASGTRYITYYSVSKVEDQQRPSLDIRFGHQDPVTA